MERDLLLDEHDSGESARLGGGEKGSKEVNVVSAGRPLLCKDWFDGRPRGLSRCVEERLEDSWRFDGVAPSSILWKDHCSQSNWKESVLGR